MVTYEELRKLFTNRNSDKETFIKELYMFLLNDKRFGKGILTKGQLVKIESFIYYNMEDDYYWENGFDNTMTVFQDLIELVLYKED